MKFIWIKLVGLKVLDLHPFAYLQSSCSCLSTPRGNAAKHSSHEVHYRIANNPTKSPNDGSILFR